jgi:hypothetical protein
MINLVSLKLPDPYYYVPEVSRWQQVILDSPNLETLHCYPDYRLSLDMYRSGKKFPVIRELRLEAVSKYMSPGIVLLWDFSNLSVLKLSGVNLKSFFKVLPFEKLSGLREFRVRVWDYHTQADSWVDEYLVPCIEAIVRLEVLEIRCAHPHKLLPALEKHRLSLQVLRLAHCITSRPPQVTVEDIEKLRTMCPYLDELALDITVAEDAEIEKQKEKDEKDSESYRELQRILRNSDRCARALFHQSSDGSGQGDETSISDPR